MKHLLYNIGWKKGGCARFRAMLRRGFTLVEFILYIALSSIVIMTLMQGMLLLLQTRSNISLRLPVQQELRFATHRITEAIRIALSINTGSSVFASDNGLLSLVMSGSLRSPTVFSLSNDAITITEGSAPPMPLTSSRVVVQQLRFEDLSAPQTPSTVKLRIQAQDIAAQKILNLETSVSLRY